MKVKMATGCFQIHEHTNLVSRVCPLPRILHAHEGGEQPHQHPGYGPAFFGHLYERYRFSPKPKGDQLPWLDLEDWQKSFEIVVCDPPKDFKGTGADTLPAERMMHGFKMRISRIVDGRREARGIA